MNLNDNNFVLFAAQHYENRNCESVEEFTNDLLSIVKIKKLFTRYYLYGTLREGLIINHIISLFNVFDNNAAIKMLFFKIDKKHYSYLKTFLTYMERCPDVVHGINNKTILIEEIIIDDTIMNVLNKN